MCAGPQNGNVRVVSRPKLRTNAPDGEQSAGESAAAATRQGARRHPRGGGVPGRRRGPRGGPGHRQHRRLVACRRHRRGRGPAHAAAALAGRSRTPGPRLCARQLHGRPFGPGLVPPGAGRPVRDDHRGRSDHEVHRPSHVGRRGCLAALRHRHDRSPGRRHRDLARLRPAHGHPVLADARSHASLACRVGDAAGPGRPPEHATRAAPRPSLAHHRARGAGVHAPGGDGGHFRRGTGGARFRAAARHRVGRGAVQQVGRGDRADPLRLRGDPADAVRLGPVHSAGRVRCRPQHAARPALPDLPGPHRSSPRHGHGPARQGTGAPLSERASLPSYVHRVAGAGRARHTRGRRGDVLGLQRGHRRGPAHGDRRPRRPADRGPPGGAGAGGGLPRHRRPGRYRLVRSDRNTRRATNPPRGRPLAARPR